MDSPDNKTPLSAPNPRPGLQSVDSSSPQEPSPPVRTDRLYQIAAVTAGIIFLATVF
jgi:hypothetical protein